MAFGTGGNALGYNAISTTPSVVALADASRQKITFHNPCGVDIFVYPTSLQMPETGLPPAPTLAAPGGCFIVYANGATLVVTSECQKVWQAFSRTGSGQSLTVFMNG
jgi:hypothetical protein